MVGASSVAAKGDTPACSTGAGPLKRRSGWAGSSAGAGSKAKGATLGAASGSGGIEGALGPGATLTCRTVGGRSVTRPDLERDDNGPRR